MSLSEEFSHLNIIFIDTAPIIYYIEAHPQFGQLAKEVVDSFQLGNVSAFSSVITLVEVLPKSIEAGDEKLARKFAEFLKHGKNFTLIEISEGIAEDTGRLRGKYAGIKTIDAIQVSAALDIGADALITNDERLKQIKEIKTILS